MEIEIKMLINYNQFNNDITHVSNTHTNNNGFADNDINNTVNGQFQQPEGSQAVQMVIEMAQMRQLFSW